MLGKLLNVPALTHTCVMRSVWAIGIVSKTFSQHVLSLHIVLSTYFSHDFSRCKQLLANGDIILECIILFNMP